MLVSKIFPDREEYEEQQEKVLLSFLLLCFHLSYFSPLSTKIIPPLPFYPPGAGNTEQEPQPAAYVYYRY